MYMIEISEDKIDNMMEHIGKGIKCLSKVAECLEEMKESSELYEEEYHHRDRYASGGKSMYRDDDRERFARGGRYGRY